jgi:hypothetical protein
VTLILTLLSRHGIYQSSDYRLTRNGAFFDERAGVKQLGVDSEGYQIKVCFTGVAIANGLKTRDWISKVIKGATLPLDLGIVATQIAARGTAAVASIPTSVPVREKMLTILIAFMERGRPKLVLISNTDRFDARRRDEPLDHLEISEIAPSRPLFRSYGTDVAVKRSDARFFKSLIRDGSDPRAIMDSLASLNARAALDARSEKRISEGCLVSSLLPDGTRRDLNFGGTPGVMENFFGDFNLGEWVRKNLKPLPGKEITLKLSVGKAIGFGKATSKQTTGSLLRSSAKGQKKIGRNDPCPCGSGKKFKKCHGQ